MTDDKTTRDPVEYLHPDLRATIRFELQSIFIANYGASNFDKEHLEAAAVNLERVILDLAQPKEPSDAQA